MTNPRILELDGLRAIAILAVIAFHFTHRFPDIRVGSGVILAPLQYGYLGVHLFFVISGFVIAMTLHASPSVASFAVRRWSRLFPPMAVCSLLTFAFLLLVSNSFTDMRRATPVDFIPSWTFTQPGIWEWLAPDVKYVDGVYWSLSFEVRFYFWAAALYFGLGREGFTRNFFVFTCLSWAGSALMNWSGHQGLQLAFLTAFISEYIGLFCAGILFHRAYSLGRFQRWVALALVACFSSALIHDGTTAGSIILAAIFAIFCVLVSRRSSLQILAARPAVAIGAISYSLYLLHQNIGVGIIKELDTGNIAGPVIALFVVLAISGAVYFAVERRAGRLARSILGVMPRGRDKAGGA